MPQWTVQTIVLTYAAVIKTIVLFGLTAESTDLTVRKLFKIA